MKVLQLLLFFVAFCVSSACYSQLNYKRFHYLDKALLFQFGLGIGGMNCITDIGGANSNKGYYLNEIRVRNTRLSANVYGGLLYHNFLGLRLQATVGKVTSADGQITNKSNANLSTKNNRNLSFQSNIAEIALLAEVHPLMFFNLRQGPLLFSPYLVGGLGYYSFNPKASVLGQSFELQPLHTEGQSFSEYPNRSPYRLSQFNIPVGIGLRYELTTNLDVRLEALHRFLFTDYLDDVSNAHYIDPELFKKYMSSPITAAVATALANPSKNGKLPARRGNPYNNDSYMTVSIQFSWTFGKQRAY